MAIFLKSPNSDQLYFKKYSHTRASIVRLIAANGKRTGSLQRPPIGLLLTGLAFVLLSVLATGEQADAAFEPNNDVLEAAGPLLGGQRFSAVFENPGDKDVYYFYVGAAEEVNAALTVENHGGGTSTSAQMEVRVIDSARTYVGGNFSYLRSGESRTDSFPLQPGKYFVEAVQVSGGGSGDAYTLSPGGNPGAFVDYTVISSNCAAATARVRTLQADLRRLQAILQRAVGRLNRSRFLPPQARRQSRAHYVAAKRRVRIKRSAVQRAGTARSPWCFIPA